MVAGLGRHFVNRHIGLAGFFDHVGGADAAGESDDEIGSALNEHCGISDGPGALAEPLPVGGERLGKDPVLLRPAFGDGVRAGGVAMDQDGDAFRIEQAVEDTMDLGGVGVIAAAADKDGEARRAQWVWSDFHEVVFVGIHKDFLLRAAQVFQVRPFQRRARLNEMSLG